MYVHVHAYCMHVCMCMHACSFVCVHVCVHLYACMYMCACVYAIKWSLNLCVQLEPQIAPCLVSYGRYVTHVCGVVMQVVKYQDSSTRVKCPNCNNDVMSNISFTNGTLTWIVVGALLLFGVW